MEVSPFRLKPWFSPRPWGRKSLKPWYEDTGTTELVGEAWLTGPQCVVEEGELAGKTLAELGSQMGDEFPLLVKLLFPNEKLSVQVHPDDAQARAAGETRGKTECWYVLEADPGASVMLGLKPGVDAKMLAASVADNTMEDLVEKVPVTVGDMLFVDAGTVHAIGPGVVLLETQQTSDVTYRLYDYGRPRELHLERGLKVIKPKTQAGKVAPKEMAGFTRLIEQKYFVVDRFELGKMEEQSLTIDGPGCLVGLKGKAWVVTPGSEVELEPGKAVVIPGDTGQVIVDAEDGATFVRCVAPVSAAASS